MKTIIFWEWEDSLKLKELVVSSLEDLWLNDFIEIEISNSDELKQELSITKTPALIIEEESIEWLR